MQCIFCPSSKNSISHKSIRCWLVSLSIEHNCTEMGDSKPVPSMHHSTQFRPSPYLDQSSAKEITVAYNRATGMQRVNSEAPGDDPGFECWGAVCCPFPYSKFNQSPEAISIVYKSDSIVIKLPAHILGRSMPSLAKLQVAWWSFSAEQDSAPRKGTMPTCIYRT